MKKSIKFFTLFLLCIIMVSCVGGKKGKISGSIEGSWTPVDVEILIKPKLYANMVPKENLDKIKQSIKEDLGRLTINSDKTFTFDDNTGDFKGEWEFTDRILDLKTPEMTYSFVVESLSDNELEIDLASIYKAMIGLTDLPTGSFFDMKMIVVFKKN